MTWNDKEDGIKDFLEELYTQRGNPPFWREKVIRYLDVINNYAKENKINTIKLNNKRVKIFCLIEID